MFLRVLYICEGKPEKILPEMHLKLGRKNQLNRPLFLAIGDGDNLDRVSVGVVVERVALRGEPVVELPLVLFVAVEGPADVDAVRDFDQLLRLQDEEAVDARLAGAGAGGGF